MIQTLCIVGDRFKGMEAHQQVSTLSSFTRALGNGDFDDLEVALVLVGGQGVGRYEWDHLAEAVARRGLSDRVIIQAGSPTLVRRGEAHKHRENNILVSDLEQAGEQHFRAALRVHNDNELLLDHQTGQHVQGMVAVEASRQMFLAVTERYYASAWPQVHYYYVLNSMATTFENFIFPFDATLDLRVQQSEITDPQRLSLVVRVEVHQAGRRCAVTEIVYTAFESSVIDKKETRRAGAAIGEILSAHEQNAGLVAAGV